MIRTEKKRMAEKTFVTAKKRRENMGKVTVQKFRGRRPKRKRRDV